MLAIAATLLRIAGLLQVLDGLQGAALGCLRGMADTRVPLVIHLVGFWGVAVPLSAWLGLERGLDARGLWWGLAAGLFLKLETAADESTDGAAGFTLVDPDGNPILVDQHGPKPSR